MPPPLNLADLAVSNTRPTPFVENIFIRQIFESTTFLTHSTRVSLPMGDPTTDTSVTIVVPSRTAATTTVAVITHMPQPPPDRQPETNFESNTSPPPIINTSFSIPQPQATGTTVASPAEEQPEKGNALPATPEESNPQVPVDGEDESSSETTMTSPVHPAVTTTMTGMGIPILTETPETTAIARESSQESGVQTKQVQPSHRGSGSASPTDVSDSGVEAPPSNEATRDSGIYKRAFVVVSLAVLLIL